MQLNINYDKDGRIVSFQAGDISQNECPDGCETLTVDDQMIKFDPDRMKILGGQLVMKG